MRRRVSPVWAVPLALMLSFACNGGKKGTNGAHSGGRTGAGGTTGSGGGAAKAGRSSSGGSSANASGGSSAATGDAGAGGAASANEAPYEATDLGEGQCVAINGRGEVLGLDADGTFLIDADGTRSALGATADGATATGVALGPNGEVVGFSESATGRRAVRFAGGAWEELAGLGGAWSAAASIDDDGAIVGTLGMEDGAVRAFLWHEGTVESLPTASSPGSSAFLRVGARTAGVLQVEQATHAFVISPTGELSDLGTLGGTNSNPFGMNANGTVVGASHDTDNQVGAFVWTPDGTMRALGVPRGARASEARGVDASGRLIGNVIDGQGVAHGVLFDPEAASPRELPLPAKTREHTFLVARAVAVTPDGAVLGVGAVRGDKVSPLRCIVWRPL